MIATATVLLSLSSLVIVPFWHVGNLVRFRFDRGFIEITKQVEILFKIPANVFISFHSQVSERLDHNLRVNIFSRQQKSIIIFPSTRTRQALDNSSGKKFPDEKIIRLRVFCECSPPHREKSLKAYTD